MDDSLKIECEWWGPSTGNRDVSQSCRGAIGISVGEICLTRLEDSWGNTVRNRVHACASTLASWFAANWWRLRWEPETPDSRNDVDWRMSHSIAAAGEGYCWPNILFASDGASIAIASRATRGRVFGPVRYLNDFYTRISGDAFERGIDDFLTLVLSRLHSQGSRNSELAQLWAEVMIERGDPELARWRRLEAICGFDPTEAPAELIQMLLDDKEHIGGKALDEVAAQGRHSTALVLQQILELANGKTKLASGGYQARLPALSKKFKCYNEARPWRIATELAQKARKEWNLEQQPITNKELAKIMGAKPTLFTSNTKSPTSMPIALRTKTSDGFDLYINSPYSTNRRFVGCRMLGDHLYYINDERLIPATTTKTSRQQFQRAFAQEFLCPYEALMEKIQTEKPDDDDIAEAAEYFGVSTRMIETTLLNKGALDRETLDWVD